MTQQPRSGGRINLNTASPEELNRIPNIGEECVRRILQYRDEKGGFKSVDELDQFKGFGEEAIRNLKENATV